MGRNTDPVEKIMLAEEKEIFLEWFSELVNDGLDRYFVPEVNSSDEDLCSIIKDLEIYGIMFCQQGTAPDPRSAALLGGR